MFSKNDNYFDKKGSRDRNLINSILAIQRSNFKPGDMRDLSNDDYKALKQLVIKIGNKLIKEDLIKEERLNLYPVAKSNYAKIIHGMSQPSNKFCFIRYAAQLIQYFTLLREQQCSNELDLQDFHQFLLINEVVNANMNLYLVENQILIIYRDLFKLEETAGKSRLTRAAVEHKLASINLQLEKLREIIDNGKIDAPYNVFVFYLSCIINHSYLKYLEVCDSLQASVGEESEISELKIGYLKLANDDLKSIETIKDSCAQLNISYAYGYEFSFGQDIFKKFGVWSETNLQCLSVGSKL